MLTEWPTHPVTVTIYIFFTFGSTSCRPLHAENGRHKLHYFDLLWTCCGHRAIGYKKLYIKSTTSPIVESGYAVFVFVVRSVVWYDRVFLFSPAALKAAWPLYSPLDEASTVSAILTDDRRNWQRSQISNLKSQQQMVRVGALPPGEFKGLN